MSCFSVFWLLALCLQKIFSGNFCLHILDTYSVLWELVSQGNNFVYRGSVSQSGTLRAVSD